MTPETLGRSDGDPLWEVELIEHEHDIGVLPPIVSNAEPPMRDGQVSAINVIGVRVFLTALTLGPLDSFVVDQPLFDHHQSLLSGLHMLPDNLLHMCHVGAAVLRSLQVNRRALSGHGWDMHDGEVVE